MILDKKSNLKKCNETLKIVMITNKDSQMNQISALNKLLRS